MESFLSRRAALQGALLAGLALTAGSASAYVSKWPAKPKVPTDFNAEELFNELEEKGRGIRFGSKENVPEVRMVFDTQCPWCVWQFEQFKPFMDRVNFVWYPVAVLGIRSEPQAAMILSAEDPIAAFHKHHELFKTETKGLDFRGLTFSDEIRDLVWQNSKCYRRAGGRDVPFGAIRMPDGKYAPQPSVKTEEFAKQLGL